MITEKDGLRHVPFKDPGVKEGQYATYQESQFFNFYDKENEIGGINRIGLEPNQKTANSMHLYWYKGKTLYNKQVFYLPLPEKDWDDIRVSGLSYKIIEPLKKFRITYDDNDIRIDLVWDGFTPVFDVPTRVAAHEMGCDGGGHYDQAGEVTGSVTIGGEQLRMKGFGFRDHSWGYRDWDARIPDLHYLDAQFERDFTFLVFINRYRDKVTKYGFIFDGKRNVPLVDFKIDIEFEKDGHSPKSAQLKLEDEGGGVTEVNVEVIALYRSMSFGRSVLNMALSKFKTKDRVGFGDWQYLFVPAK